MNPSSDLSLGEVAPLLDDLAKGAVALAEIPGQALRSAWHRLLDDVWRPDSFLRRGVDDHLTAAFGLSPLALQAALESIVDGVAGDAAEAVFEAAAGRCCSRPLWVVLASNIPALALQPLLPALALRRPVLFKTPSSEPLLTPRLLDRLSEIEPRLRPALAARSWRGGDASLEEAVLQGVGRVVAYGGGPAMDALGRLAGERLIAFGPKMSLAILGDGPNLERKHVDGLARDIALFEQRGCLSVQAVLVVGPRSASASRHLADDLAVALRRLGAEWPVEQSALREVAPSLRALRDEATMRGLYQPELDLEDGTVVVEERVETSGQGVEPSPGGRCVRIYPIENLEAVHSVLNPWRGRLQGVALHGVATDQTHQLKLFLNDLGVTRYALPGELQQPDASWRNGGLSLVDELAQDP